MRKSKTPHGRHTSFLAIQFRVFNWNGNSGSNPEQALLRINSFGQLTRKGTSS
jgi:hypothetical protein